MHMYRRDIKNLQFTFYCIEYTSSTITRYTRSLCAMLSSPPLVGQPLYYPDYPTDV